MNSELKDKWCEALENGSYKQGRDRLRRGNKFCCMGVICDIVDPAGWSNLGQSEDTGITMFTYQGHLFMPPDDLDIPYRNKLAELNDKDGKTFKEISQWIKENL